MSHVPYEWVMSHTMTCSMYHPLHTFSKVSPPLNVPYKINIQLTFENFYHYTTFTLFFTPLPPLPPLHPSARRGEDPVPTDSHVQIQSQTHKHTHTHTHARTYTIILVLRRKS